MSRNIIASLVFRARKSRRFFVEFRGESFGLDELLTMLLGREVEYGEAVSFLNRELRTQ